MHMRVLPGPQHRNALLLAAFKFFYFFFPVGEYYLDRNTGTLYFWPPASLDTHEAFVSFGDYTLVLGGTGGALNRALTEP